MLIQAILLLTLIAYGIIVSQSFMYMIALKDVSLGMDARSYIEFRKLIDISFRKKFSFVIYSALLSNLVLVILCILQDPASLLFMAASFSLLALFIDTSITLKGNLPINDMINTWTAEKHPPNWMAFRDQWLQFFQYRQIANISGFIILLIGVVFN